MDLLTAIAKKNWHAANEAFAILMGRKVADRLVEERRSIIVEAAETKYILWAIPKGKTDRLDEVPLTSMPISQANVDRVKKAAGADGWHSFRTTVEDGAVPDFGRAIKEAVEPLPASEIQRVFDEVGDITEVELLCNVRNLRVNQAGQVIGYQTEATSRGVKPSITNAHGDPLITWECTVKTLKGTYQWFDYFPAYAKKEDVLKSFKARADKCAVADKSYLNCQLSVRQQTTGDLDPPFLSQDVIAKAVAARRARAESYLYPDAVDDAPSPAQQGIGYGHQFTYKVVTSPYNHVIATGLSKEDADNQAANYRNATGVRAFAVKER